VFDWKKYRERGNINLMKKTSGFEYFDAPGEWYKGNLHTHTERSDSMMQVEKTIDLYQNNGYDFLAITDHNEYCDECLDGAKYGDKDLILIPGIEYGFISKEHKLDYLYHIVAINIKDTLKLGSYGTYEPQYVIDGITDSGGLAIIAHPYWSGNLSGSFIRLKDYSGIEVYNHCTDSIKKGYAETYWDDLLNAGIIKWGFAADDFHGLPEFLGGGWIMVKSGDRSGESIVDAIEKGMFYSTQSINILNAAYADGKVDIYYDRACSAVFRGHSWHSKYVSVDDLGDYLIGPDGNKIFHASYDLNGDEKYMRIELIDETGKKAYTNPIVL
jgi:hypothetical protein